MEPNHEASYQEYERRHSFWTEQALNQLGYSLNLFFTLNVAFLGYVIEKRKSYPLLCIDFKSQFDWRLSIYFVVIILLSATLLIGAVSIISRLWDLRITRYVVWIRKRALKKFNTLFPDNYIDISKDNRLLNFFKSVFVDTFLDDKDFEDVKILKQKFEMLRKRQKLLGRLTWSGHRIQIVLILFASIVYSVLALFQL